MISKSFHRAGISLIELLEARIAPAVLIVNPTTATYTDVDGDHVTIKVSAGTLVPGNFFTVPVNGHDQLQLIDLSKGGFDNVNLTVSVVAGPEGDGLAAVGYINSTGHPLGAVSIQGDLGRINAGPVVLAENSTAIKSLAVQSMGRYGTDTQAAGGILESYLFGGLGSLRVKGDVAGELISVTNGDDPGVEKIGSVTIGGSLIGGAKASSGEILSSGDIGAVTIRHDIQGGAGSSSGRIQAAGMLTSVHLGGSLIGGTNTLSGSISTDGDMGAVTIVHNVEGGTGDESGKIDSLGKLTSVSVGGAVIGASGNYNTYATADVVHQGQIYASSGMGAVTIGHDLKGGSGANSGEIFSGAGLTSVRLGGSLIGGSNAFSGSIFSSADMGPVNIAHDVEGGTGDETGKIDAAGKLTSVTIVGSVIGGSGRYDTLTGANVFHEGQICAVGDLGLVKIGGDVQGGSGIRSGMIASGSGKLAGVNIGGSLLGGSVQQSGSISSEGDLGLVRIGGNVQGGSGGLLTGSIDTFGKLTGLIIGGSLIGGTTDNSGYVIALDGMGAVTIGHDLRGGTGNMAGYITAEGGIASVTVGGSLIGGNTVNSGVITTSAGDVGAVKIGHDVLGGAGTGSGDIDSAGKIASVTIGGSLIGGTNNGTGGISSTGDLGAVRIVHDLRGGSITGSTSVDASGVIDSFGRIASVSIGGSIVSGTDTGSGSLTRNASIGALDDIGSLTVEGDIVGNVSSGGTTRVTITAGGPAVTAGRNTIPAIGKIDIGGRVEWTDILAGYGIGRNAVNGDAQIGAVTVGGDWAASNLVAGVKNLGADGLAGGTGANADNVNFGDSHDASIGGGNLSVIAKIASISIRGQVAGSPSSVSPSDHFGFVAQQIGAFKEAGFTAVLHAGPPADVIQLSFVTGDVTIREV